VGNFIPPEVMNSTPPLTVYAMTEFRLRRTLQEIGEMVIGQTEKHTQNPRLKWIFFCSRGARGLRFQARKAVTVIVTNIVPELWKGTHAAWEEI
jgi:hypothetical protein